MRLARLVKRPYYIDIHGKAKRFAVRVSWKSTTAITLGRKLNDGKITVRSECVYCVPVAECCGLI